jgi:hypothetical protein
MIIREGYHHMHFFCMFVFHNNSIQQKTSEECTVFFLPINN